MDNTQENAIEIHGDEEIIEVIDLNETEPCPGELKTVYNSSNKSLLAMLTACVRLYICFGNLIKTYKMKLNRIANHTYFQTDVEGRSSGFVAHFPAEGPLPSSPVIFNY